MPTDVQPSSQVRSTQQDLEPVYVFPWSNKSAIAWPSTKVQDNAVWGMVFLPFLFAEFLFRFGSVFAYLAAAVIALAVLLGIRLAIKLLGARMAEKPYRGPLPQGTLGRLRVLFPSELLVATVATFDDAPFEPMILRCVQDVAFAGLDEEDCPKVKHATKKTIANIQYYIADTNPSTRARKLTNVAAFIFGLGTIFIMKRLATGVWIPGGEALLGGLALGALIAALAKPAYLRIAPGVLDVLSYPPLGFGVPRCERYNLRTASIIADDKTGWVGIFDRSRTQHQVVYIRRRWVLTRDSVAALLINAARSSQPTPPLPMDELLG